MKHKILRTCLLVFTLLCILTAIAGSAYAIYLLYAAMQPFSTPGWMFMFYLECGLWVIIALTCPTALVYAIVETWKNELDK